MAWSSPITAVSGAALNAADFNTYIRDNLNETTPALATSADGQWFVADGANSLVAREVETDTVSGNLSVTGTSFGGAAQGPSVTLTTGAFVIVNISAHMHNDGSNSASIMDFEISGATTRSGQNVSSLMIDGLTANNDNYIGVSTGVVVNPGVNTFSAVYRTGSGTASFSQRRLTVWSF